MLPFHEQDCIALGQLELNNPQHPLPNTSYFPFNQLDGFHDLLFAAEGCALAAPARPSVPLVDSVPLQPQSAVMRSAAAGHKRPTRKGRHSKICTAAGPRDRRMRLSIDVARSFFRLQDMLGFDKASKTVKWLLTMSKAAIKDLARSVSSSKNICSSSSDRSPKSESSTLACEASSSANKAAASANTAEPASKAKKSRTKKEAVKATKSKPEFHSAQARELRAKARERARERTKEKQRSMTTNAAINFDAIKDEVGLQDLKSMLEFAHDGGQGLNTGCEEHYDYTMTGGPLPPVLIPILGSGPPLLLPPAAVAAAEANSNASGNFFEEQWEMEALSLYSRSLQAAFGNYPN